MTYKEVLNDIKKNELKPVYLFYGNEVFLRDFCVKEIKKTYVDASLESMNYIEMDGKEVQVSEVVNASETLPFMADKKIVIVNDCQWFSSNVKSNEIEELIKYLKRPSDTTSLIFIVKSDSIDKRKKQVKEIKKLNGMIEFSKIKGKDLTKWISKIFKKNGKMIKENEIKSFIQITGYIDNNSNKNLYDLENEVIKVSNYLGERKQVEQEDIEKILVKSLQNNIFRLVDGIGNKNYNQSIFMFNEMILSNEPPQLIIYMIIRQFRLLIMAKLLQSRGYSIGNISKKMGVPNFVARKLISQSNNFNIDELKEGLKKCLESDKKIKKGEMDSKLAVEVLIMSFMG